MASDEILDAARRAVEHEEHRAATGEDRYLAQHARRCTPDVNGVSNYGAIAAALLASEAECERLREECHRAALAAMNERNAVETALADERAARVVLVRDLAEARKDREVVIEHAQNVERMNVVLEDNLRESERQHAQAVDDLQAVAEEMELQTAELDVTRKMFNGIVEELERERVRLAGCSVAAHGFAADTKPGDYGHSASFDDVRALRREYERLKAELSAAISDAARLRAEVERVTAVAERMVRWIAESHAEVSQDGWAGLSSAIELLSDLRGRTVDEAEAEAWLRGGAK